jgi:hypothetical protein
VGIIGQLLLPGPALPRDADLVADAIECTEDEAGG